MKFSTKVLTVLMICVIAPGLVLAKGGGPNVSGAKLYIKQSDLEKAEEILLKEVNEVNADNEDAWYLLGYLYARQKKYDQMVEAFNKAVELKPKFRESGVKINGDTGTLFHARIGADKIMAFIWANSFNDAVKVFNEAVNATDDSMRVKSFEKAYESFRVTTLIAPDSMMAYRNMAASLMNLGKYEESTVPLKNALEHKPDDADVKTMLAQVYMQTGADSLAMPILIDLWKMQNRSSDIAAALSRAYLRQGDEDKAKEVYKQALEQDPENYDFRYNYGTLLLEANEFDGAIEQLQKAQEMRPDAADINYNLGAAYLNRGVFKRDALPEDSDDESYKEEFKLALPYLEKAILMNPDDENTWFTLGRIAGQLSKVALAGFAFSKGEQQRSALDKKVVLGMDGSTLKMIIGEPDQIRAVESEQFASVEEWAYNKRAGKQGKLSIPDAMNVYVKEDRVEALMVVK